ncbi:MAG TPA: hypothetical protein VNT25_00020 [Allosphingosinicella sp.]|nr:hypothetical protein [Allosphingosinicella sp.]
MKTVIGLTGLGLVVASLAACGAIREAHMAVPSGVASSTERLELKGMGGWHKGRFQLAGSEGRFTRSAEKADFFDSLWVKRRGGGTFSLSGPEVEGELSGSCRYSEDEVNIGPFSARPKRLSYRCDFSHDGRPIDARLILEENDDSLGSAFMKEERDGALYFEGQRIGLRSIHKIEESRISLATPIGYMFDLRGRDIGGVDLNGSDHTLFVPRDRELRQAVLAASVALSVFWDPADTDPDR